MIFKMIVLILSLGLDTLMISASLGVLQVQNRTRIALAFACTEALMPLVGFLVGQSTGHVVGQWASLVGAFALIGLGVYLMFFEDDDEGEKLTKGLVGWTLVMTLLTISLDELAIGFSLGLIQLPVGITMLLIAVQAFLFTLLGLKFGVKLKPYLGEWAEKAVGGVLALLGLWLLVEHWVG